MTSNTDLFGTLRSLLQQEPSSTQFKLIIEFLAAHAEHEALHEVWLPYAADILKSWPDISRTYGGIFHEEELEPLLQHKHITRLVTCIYIGRCTPPQLHKIAHHPWLSHHTHHTLRSGHPDHREDTRHL